MRYPADTEVDVGANDMSAHVQSTINGCPNTRVVLGGYSLGAAVTDVVMAAPGPMFGFTNPLPPGADQHIAAVALFGNGTQWVGPITNFNPVYTDRTIDLCHGTDPICNPADPHTWSDNWPQHAGNPISTTAWSIRPPTSSRASCSNRFRWAGRRLRDISQPCRPYQQFISFAR